MGGHEEVSMGFWRKVAVWICYGVLAAGFLVWFPANLLIEAGKIAVDELKVFVARKVQRAPEK
jgi:hypothetical protein